MSELAGSSSSGIHWFGTFGAVLLPGLITGALLGWAEHLRRQGGVSGWRWLAFAPLTFAIAPMLEPGALTAFLTMGLGGGAVGVALLGASLMVVLALAAAIPQRAVVSDHGSAR